MEAYNYPLMSVQFHPEKIATMFNYENVDRLWDTLHYNRFFADKFVSLARQNTNDYGNEDISTDAIYNYLLFVSEGYNGEVYVFE